MVNYWIKAHSQCIAKPSIGFVLKSHFDMRNLNVMQRTTTNLLLILVTCLTLNACGTKGPLYIPEQRYPQDTPAKN